MHSSPDMRFTKRQTCSSPGRAVGASRAASRPTGGRSAGGKVFASNSSGGQDERELLAGVGAGAGFLVDAPALGIPDGDDVGEDVADAADPVAAPVAPVGHAVVRALRRAPPAGLLFAGPGDRLDGGARRTGRRRKGERGTEVVPA
jgi:hypothetical protein